MGKYNFPEDSSDTQQFVNLKGQVDRQQRASQLGQSSVPGGAGGTALPVSQLAYGLQAVSAVGSLAHGTKSVWTADGLSVSVNCTTGRMLLMLGATITMGSPTGVDIVTGYYGFVLVGPTGQAATPDQAVRSDFGSFAFQGSIQSVLTGLTPGLYTIQGAMMATTSGTDALPTVGTSRRSIVVIPF